VNIIHQVVDASMNPGDRLTYTMPLAMLGLAGFALQRVDVNSQPIQTLHVTLTPLVHLTLKIVRCKKRANTWVDRCHAL